jgi:hypothetical protein
MEEDMNDVDNDFNEEGEIGNKNIFTSGKF